MLDMSFYFKKKHFFKGTHRTCSHLDTCPGNYHLIAAHFKFVLLGGKIAKRKYDQ